MIILLLGMSEKNFLKNHEKVSQRISSVMGNFSFLVPDRITLLFLWKKLLDLNIPP